MGQWRRGVWFTLFSIHIHSAYCDMYPRQNLPFCFTMLISVFCISHAFPFWINHPCTTKNTVRLHTAAQMTKTKSVVASARPNVPDRSQFGSHLIPLLHGAVVTKHTTNDKSYHIFHWGSVLRSDLFWPCLPCSVMPCMSWRLVFCLSLGVREQGRTQAERSVGNRVHTAVADVSHLSHNIIRQCLLAMVGDGWIKDDGWQTTKGEE